MRQGTFIQPRVLMKANFILLVDSDADSVGLVLEAAARTSRGVRVARNSPEALELLKNGVQHVDVMIVDADPAAQGLALLKVVSGWKPGAPLLVLSAFQDPNMNAIAAQHGATACLCKPLSIEQLRFTLDRTLKDACETMSLSQQIKELGRVVVLKPLRLGCSTAAWKPAPLHSRSPSTCDVVDPKSSLSFPIRLQTRCTQRPSAN